MRVCRLCLHEGPDDLISVLDDEDIVEKIKECVSIEITDQDELPTTACNSCIEKIKDWSNFKDICFQSSKVLLELINKKRKGCRKGKLRDYKDKFKLLEEEDSDDIKFLLVVEDDKQELYDNELQIELPENVYTCDICWKEFNNCIEYLDHQFTHNGEPVFKCDKCPEIYSSRDGLVEHDRNHKRPCPKCGKMILKSSMKLHLIKHTDRHMCTQCSGRFNSRASLQQHVITIHTDRKDHICETCGKRFSSKTAMTVHLRSHSDERLYRCKLCDYAGRTASAVYVHMSTHAQEVCVCEVCSKIFKSNRNLNDHLRRVHSREKKHECSYCSKKFVDKYMLTVHVRCHTGVRPYQCHLCDKAFIRSDGLKEHMAIHGERVWYCCDKCGRKFASKKGVTRHHCSGITTL